MVSDQDEVELWDASTDLRKWSTEVQGVQEILATPNGCILRTNTELIGYDEAGTARHYALGADRDKEGSEPVTAMSVVGSEVLAASGDQISRHRLNGERTATYKLTKGISALSLIPAKPNQAGTLVIGFDDGSVETLDLGSLDYGYNTQVVIQRSAKVTRIIPVQGGLIAIGMANGWAGLWDSSSRRLLDHVELHGSIAHLLAEDGQVHVASDLGDAHSWNVEVFGRDLCQLTRDMWSAVPVKWLYGRAVFMDPPQQHPCHSTD